MKRDLPLVILIALGLAPIAGCRCGPCLSFCPQCSSSDSGPEDTEPPDTESPDSDPPDADGDGSPDAEDCDDEDETIHPGAEEVCDGVDNDCDGEIDEGLGTTWYEDFDGDGYGAPGTGVVVCDACLTGYVRDASDCDDGDADSYPGAPELCDGRDNDCDDEVDEDCHARSRGAAQRRLASEGVLPRDVADRLASSE